MIRAFVLTRMRRLLALVLCLVPAAGAGAASNPALQDVMNRWVEAALGPQRPARGMRAVVMRADTLEDGIPGRVEEWLDRNGWRRVTSQNARLREEVCRGGVAWVKDWNGKVLELQGRDRREQLTAALIEGLLFGGTVPGVLVDGQAELARDDAQPDLVIRLSPKDGVPFDLFLDKVTGLPTKVVRKSFDDEVTLELSDWRTVGGRKFPFFLRQSSGKSEGESRSTVREVVEGGRAVSFARPGDGPKDFRFAKGGAALGIPFNFENDHLMVQGRVNGSKPLWFMLDTGAEATIVNKGRLGELGLQPFGVSSISGGGGSTEFAFADVARLEIGGAALLNQRDGVIDLAGLERIYGMPMGGLLGYDFFSRFVVRVNYDTKTIDLLEPSSHAYRSSGTRIPFILEGGQPHISSKISVPTVPPIDADLIVDAGAADTVNLTAPFVKANRLLELARKTPAPGPNTLAGSEKEFFAQTSVRGKLQSVSLGPFELKDIPSNLMVNTKGAYASESFSGVIGEGVLHRFNTIYDYSKNVMILEPNAELDKPFPPRKTFGATFLSDGPDYTVFTVTGVRKDSPAETAGLKKDDVVLAIDEAPAGTLRLADVRKQLGEDGAHHRLRVQRGDETITIDTTVSLVTLDEK
jgi:hypothetical protein